MAIRSDLPADGPAAALAARDVTFRFGADAVLENLSVDISANRMTAIIGPNGAGKSTLAHLLIGFLQPEHGVVELLGKPRLQYTAAQAAGIIAFVPQFSQVSFGYSVRDIVRMGRWPRRSSSTGLNSHSPADLAAVDQAMWDTDVQHLARRTFNELSGGERQRVVIARALAQQAPVIVLDEPTTGLDLWHQLVILGLLRKLAREQGRTIVLVSHDLNMALNHCDQAILLQAGKRVAAGPVKAVLTPAILESVYRVRVNPVGDQLHFSLATA